MLVLSLSLSLYIYVYGVHGSSRNQGRQHTRIPLTRTPQQDPKFVETLILGHARLTGTLHPFKATLAPAAATATRPLRIRAPPVESLRQQRVSQRDSSQAQCEASPRGLGGLTPRLHVAV